MQKIFGINKIMRAKNLFAIFCALVLFIPSFSSASLTDGLVGYWTMNGADINWGTNTITDASGNANSGTLVNGPVKAIGKTGQAIYLDGYSTYVSIANSSSLNSGSFSAALWYKQNPYCGNFVNFFRKTTNNFATPTGWGIVRELSDALTFDIGVNGGYRFFTTATVETNKWVHLVFTYDQNTGTQAVYKNGAFAGSQTNTSGAITSNTSAVTLGGGGGSLGCTAGGYAGGSYDDVRIYNRALSAAEVTQLYKFGVGTIAASPRVATSTSATGLSNGLVGYWTLDGKNTNWRTNTTSDSSGNNNTGTLNNMSTTTSGVLGKIGQGLFFNGQSSSASNVNIPSSSSLQFNGAVPITLSAWVYPTQNSTYGTFLVKGRESNDGAANYALRQDVTGKKLEFYYNDAGSATWQVWITSANVFSTTNKWYHVVVTDTIGTGSSILAYVNGQLLSGTWSGGTGNVTADVDSQAVTLGWKANSGGTNEQFKGILDDVRIYNRILSQAEVTQLYKLGGGTIAASPRVATSTSATGLSNGLQGYWTMDGKDINWSANTMTDRSGNGNTGTLISMSTTTSPVLGKIGQGLFFTGSGSVVQIPNSTNLNPSTITISSWVKTNTNATASIVGKDNPGTSNRVWQFRVESTGQITFIIFRDSDGTNSQTTSSISVNDNKWHLVTGSWNGATISVYVDGVLSNSSSYSGILQQGKTNSVFIGRDETGGGPSYFPGIIDDVRIYNRALSANEVAQLYKQGTSKIR